MEHDVDIELGLVRPVMAGSDGAQHRAGAVVAAELVAVPSGRGEGPGAGIGQEEPHAAGGIGQLEPGQLATTDGDPQQARAELLGALH